MDEQIIERLCKLRKEHGYSQEQLADELGVSRQAISKWERGEASPDTDNLIALAKLYNTSLDGLLFNDPPEAEEKENKDEKPLSLSEIKRKLENGEKVEVNGEVHEMEEPHSHMDTVEGAVAGITVLVCCIAYFLMGGVWGLWHPGWLVFFLIPVLPTIPAAIKEKDPRVFCFPVLIAGNYLLFGFVFGWWHPGWVIFLTIPIYYIIADLIKKNRT